VTSLTFEAYERVQAGLASALVNEVRLAISADQAI
jgi:hypothetical protein